MKPASPAPPPNRRPPWSKLLTVAREEITYHLRQWTFYLSLLGTVAVFAAAGALPRLQGMAQASPLASVETVFTVSEELTVPTGYVDYAGLITAVPDNQTDKFKAFADEAAAAQAMRLGHIESYYVIAADYIQGGQVHHYSPDPQLLVGADDALKKLLRDNLLLTLPDPALAGRLVEPMVLTYQGPPPPAFSLISPEIDLSQLFSAGLVVGLFAIVINVGGMLLLRALQREVRARALEVLVASATLEQFIGGKLVGLSGLALGQVGLALAGALLVYGQNPDGSGPAALPLATLALSLPYLLLGYLAYSGLILAIAAIWPNLPESMLLLAAIRLVVFSPLLGLLFLLPDPDSPLAVVLTVIPPAAPLLMPFRLILGPVPWWQWWLSLAGLALWAWLLLWLSLRLFRAYSLLTGRPVTLRTLRQALTQ